MKSGMVISSVKVKRSRIVVRVHESEFRGVREQIYREGGTSLLVPYRLLPTKYASVLLLLT